MIVPLQITFRDMPVSEAVEQRIREKVAKLERYSERITGCHVVVEMPQRHKHQGKLHSVHIDLTVPGAELAVNRIEHEDVFVAVRDAFSAAQRQLESFVERQRGDVKTHASSKARA